MPAPGAHTKTRVTSEALPRCRGRAGERSEREGASPAQSSVVARGLSGQRGVAAGEAWRGEAWALGRVGAVRRALGQQLKGHGDGALQLRVCATRVVLRGDVHLDIRIGAVVLDAPAHVIEVE